RGLAPFARPANPKPAAGDTRPTSCPTDRCADESPVPMSRVPQDSSRLAGAAASGEARRGLLVYVWRNRYPGWPNPNHSSSPCSFSFSMNSGASSMIRVLLSAPLCLHIRLSSRFTCWPDIWIVPIRKDQVPQPSTDTHDIILKMLYAIAKGRD